MGDSTERGTELLIAFRADRGEILPSTFFFAGLGGNCLQANEPLFRSIMGFLQKAGFVKIFVRQPLKGFFLMGMPSRQN